MAVVKANQPLDMLQQMINEVLVHTGKALKAGARNPSQPPTQPQQTPAALQAAQTNMDSGLATRIPACIETFNFALDDLESELLRAKAVLQRDLDQLREMQRPAAQEDSNAPTADVPPGQDHRDQTPTAVSPGVSQPANLEAVAVAPFPDMDVDFDLTYPSDVSIAPPMVPATAAPTAQKASPAKQSPMPAGPGVTAPAVASATGTASSPPRKETKVPLPQFPRSAQTTPKLVTTTTAPGASGAASTAATAAPTTQPDQQPPDSAASLSGPELGFTDMAFTLAPSTDEGQGQGQEHDSVPPQPDFDLESFEPADGSANLMSLDGFPEIIGDDDDPGAMDAALAANNATTTAAGAADAAGVIDVDAGNIDDLFNLDSAVSNMELDLNLDGEGGEHSNFEDLYFNGDVNMEGGDFDSTSFGFE